MCLPLCPSVYPSIHPFIQLSIINLDVFPPLNSPDFITILVSVLTHRGHSAWILWVGFPSFCPVHSGNYNIWLFWELNKTKPLKHWAQRGQTGVRWALVAEMIWWPRNFLGGTCIVCSEQLPFDGSAYVCSLGFVKTPQRCAGLHCWLTVLPSWLLISMSAKITKKSVASSQ